MNPNDAIPAPTATMANYHVEVDGQQYIEQQEITINGVLSAVTVGPLFVARCTEAIIYQGGQPTFDTFVEPKGRSVLIEADNNSILLERQLATLLAKAILKLVDGELREQGLLEAVFNSDGVVVGFNPVNPTH